MELLLLIIHNMWLSILAIRISMRSRILHRFVEEWLLFCPFVWFVFLSLSKKRTKRSFVARSRLFQGDWKKLNKISSLFRIFSLSLTWNNFNLEKVERFIPYLYRSGVSKKKLMELSIWRYTYLNYTFFLPTDIVFHERFVHISCTCNFAFTSPCHEKNKGPVGESLKKKGEGKKKERKKRKREREFRVYLSSFRSCDLAGQRNDSSSKKWGEGDGKRSVINVWEAGAMTKRFRVEKSRFEVRIPSRVQRPVKIYDIHNLSFRNPFDSNHDHVHLF